MGKLPYHTFIPKATGPKIHPLILISTYTKMHHLNHPETSERLTSIVRWEGGWREVLKAPGTHLNDGNGWTYSKESFPVLEDAYSHFLAKHGYQYIHEPADTRAEDGSKKKRAKIPKDCFGFKLDSLNHYFGEMLLKSGGVTRKEVAEAEWNENNKRFHGAFRRLVKKDLAEINDDGKMEATSFAKNRS